MDAADRNRRDFANDVDRSEAMKARVSRLLSGQLPASRNTGLSGVNLTRYFGPWSTPLRVARPSVLTGRNPRLAASSTTSVGEILIRAREFAATRDVIHKTVGIHQALQQRETLATPASRYIRG